MSERTKAELVVYDGDDCSITNPGTYSIAFVAGERGQLELFGEAGRLSFRAAAKIGIALLKYAFGELEVTHQERVFTLSMTGDEGIAEPREVLRNDRSGFVYVLHSNGLYKIGHSKYVDKRIEQISPVMPYPVELVIAFAADDRYALEGELHQRYASKRLRGEWFALNSQDLYELGVRT